MMRRGRSYGLLSWQTDDEKFDEWQQAQPDFLQRDPLYRALGSTPANITDGYGRSSGRDRVRVYEYALAPRARAFPGVDPQRRFSVRQSPVSARPDCSGWFSC